MAHHYEEENYNEEMPSQGKGKGMQPLTTAPSSVQSSQGYSALPVKKSRGRQSACAPQASGNDIRDISVSTAMSRLRIDEGPPSLWVNEYQAISKKLKPVSTPGSSQKALISTGLGDIGINNIEKALVPFQAQKDSSVAPKTPSHIPVLSKSGTMTTTPATPSRTPKVYPQTNNFLTKSSNIPGFKAWDVDIRLEEMDSFYKKIEALTGTNVEHFEETMGLYKSRSKPSNRRCPRYY
jgi:kinesin family protein C1